MLNKDFAEELERRSKEVIDLSVSCPKCRFNVPQTEGDFRRWCLLFEQSLTRFHPIDAGFPSMSERAIECTLGCKVYVLDRNGNGTGT